ncbi:MAG: cyclic nucleotide-binding domain-containing protein [Fimbriimonadaceae bacterium]
MDLTAGIKNSYMADGLTDQQVAAIASISELLTATDMQTIVNETEEANDIFIILDGKVRVTTIHGDPIARLQKGALVGEIALFGETERSATVISDGDSSLIRISANKLNGLMNEQPQIGLQILRNIGRTLCQRLRSSNVQLEAVLGVL